jgi:hypothetical protein
MVSIPVAQPKNINKDWIYWGLDHDRWTRPAIVFRLLPTQAVFSKAKQASKLRARDLNADAPLPSEVTKADIEAHFASHGTGEITEIKLMNGFGFIEYKDAMDARDVVPGMLLALSLPRCLTLRGTP